MRRRLCGVFHVADRLNELLRKCDKPVRSIDNTSFSIALNEYSAKLFITWRHEDSDYFVLDFKAFLLEDLEHYKQFQKYVKNILEWGRGERLKDIRAALDSLLEEKRETTAKTAKPREPLLSEASGRGGKRSSKQTGQQYKNGIDKSRLLTQLSISKQ
jgi:CRISPR/Cas system CMR-associated protein Cmr1 (group 7 of RAMP superfamily)